MIYTEEIDIRELIDEMCGDPDTFSLISSNIKMFKNEFKTLEGKRTPSWLILYITIYTFVNDLYKNGHKLIIEERDVKVYLDIHLEGFVNDLINAEKIKEYDDEELFDAAYTTVEGICDLWGFNCYNLCKDYASKI